jgi:hypothetical protein
MKFYEKPKQVIFADPENPGEWLAGIAFHDSIICSCCGGVFEIEDVIKQAEEDGVVKPIYEYSEWSDITDDVYGGVLPEGLEHSEGAIVETASAEYEQHYFILEEEEEAQAAVFANTWVDGVAMPDPSNP